jgi:hypothetical protein
MCIHIHLPPPNNQPPPAQLLTSTDGDGDDTVHGNEGDDVHPPTDYMLKLSLAAHRDGLIELGERRRHLLRHQRAPRPSAPAPANASSTYCEMMSDSQTSLPPCTRTRWMQLAAACILNAINNAASRVPTRSRHAAAPSMKISVSLFIQFLYGHEPNKASIRLICFHLRRLPLPFTFTVLARQGRAGVAVSLTQR